MLPKFPLFPLRRQVRHSALHNLNSLVLQLLWLVLLLTYKRIRRRKSEKNWCAKLYLCYLCFQTEYPRFENGRFVYRIHRSPMCEYMINFIHKLKHLPEKYMMNSVLENFTILQVCSPCNPCPDFVAENRVPSPKRHFKTEQARVDRPNTLVGHWQNGERCASARGEGKQTCLVEAENALRFQNIRPFQF